MGRRPLPPWPPPQKQPVSDDNDRLALRQPHHGGPRGACGGNSGLRGPGTPAFSPGAARTGSARRRDQIRRGGAPTELCGQAKFTPRLGFHWAGTAECGGHLARSELGAYEPPPPPGASRLLGVRAPERRQAARAPARDPHARRFAARPPEVAPCRRARRSRLGGRHLPRAGSSARAARSGPSALTHAHSR